LVAIAAAAVEVVEVLGESAAPASLHLLSIVVRLDNRLRPTWRLDGLEAEEKWAAEAEREAAAIFQ
jgi:hypothetical protein